MRRTTLRIMPLAALLLGATVAILLAQSAAGEGLPQSLKSLQTSPTQTQGLVVTFETPEDAADILPGERVKFRVSVENLTDRPQTNLYVGVVVSHNPEALEYVDRSAFASYGDRARKPLSAALDKRGTTVDETFDPGERVEVEWEMTVSECVVRDRWVQVVFLARTDGHDTSRAFENLYLYPHTSIPTHHFTPSYHVDPRTPAPGDAVRHTVRVVNDGYMRLDNVVIHVNGHETIDRYLPTIAANSVYHLLSRGNERTSSGPIDSGWSGADTGFNLNYLNPGQTLVLSWVDYVASDALAGTVVRPQVDIRPAQANKWTPVAGRLTVSPPANDLSMSMQSIDPEYLTPSYLPGDRVTMRVIVTNHSATARDDLYVDLDLPFALSYVPGSTYLCTDQGDGDSGCGTAYAVLPYQNGNARRVADTWLDTSASLPILRPGGTAAITFRAMILEDALPQQDIALHAALRSTSSGDEHRATTRLDIVRRAEVDVAVDGPTTAESGDVVRYEVSIENVGQADLLNVSFGIEETCGITYVPDTLEITLPSGETTRDDSFVIYQRRDLDDTTYLIGDLPAWTLNGPNNEVKISLTMQIADDVNPGNIAGPRFVVNADSNAPAVAGTKNVRLQGIREETEIEVVESFVTAAEFEDAVTDILAKIRATTTATGATATKLEKTTRTIEKQADEITAISENTEDLATDINEKVEDVLAQVVEDANPWDQSFGWILSWGSFGLLASFLAGLLLAFPAWETLKWVWRKWGTGLWLAMYEAVPSGGRSPVARRRRRHQRAKIAASAREVRRWVGDQVRRRPPDGDEDT